MKHKTPVSNEIKRAITETRAAYEYTATLYDKQSLPFHKSITYPRIISLTEQFLNSLSGKKILDVGCGSGSLMQMLEKYGAKCFGVDITPKFVEMAQSRNLSVQEASMHDLPFVSNSFDCVISNYALNYLPAEGQRLALCEIRRVLRLHGIVICTYMHPFFMRLGRYQKTEPHYPPVIKDYFSPARQEVIHLLDQQFTVHLLDWPEITNMTIECGLSLQKVIDAEVPNNLNQITSRIEDPKIAQFVGQFQYNPYGIFFVSIKSEGKE